MAYTKWIGGFLGFINSQSVLGGIAGFVLGAIFDYISDKNNKESDTASETQSHFMSEEVEGTRNGFLFSLMVLSAHIIQADGKIMHSEMELVRQFLRECFGEKSVTQGNDILLKLFEYRKQKGESLWNAQIRDACGEMINAMPEEHRIQMIAYLAEIAKADGKVDTSELNAIKDVALYLGLSPTIVDQMFSLGRVSLEDAYNVLGISPDATDDEVRKAYKRIVVIHHPDRVANLGEDVKEAATRKLQEINKAKEIIYKSRNMK